MRLRSLAALAAVVAAVSSAGCGDSAGQKARAEYLIVHPNMPKPIRDAIRKKAIIRGMTKADVRVCWGKPSKIERGGDRSEAWLYKRRVTGATSNAHIRTYRIVFIAGRVASFVEISRTR